MKDRDDNKFLRIGGTFGEDEEEHGSEKITYDTEAIDKELNDKINAANKRFDSIVASTEAELRSVRKTVNDQLKEVTKQIDESKNRVVETLALFAALFTFLSLQVQIFKDERDPDIVIGIVLITGGLITFFVLILDLMIKSKGESNNLMKTRFFLLFATSILLIIAGTLLIKSHN